jgi:hypothetical protein
MRRLFSVTCGFLFLWMIILGCGGGGNSADDGNTDNEPGLRMGILQYRGQHNLQDNTCLPDHCDLTFEEETDTAAWLNDLTSLSNMAVLHWDRPIPWLAFDENPPQGVSRIDFYDGRIDDRLRNWLDAFVVHFQRMSQGYVAVSLLNGERNGIQKYRVDETLEAEVTGPCPVLSPGTQIQFTYNPGSGPVTASFDLERSYTNFLMYLYDKLQPDYLALMVETNLYKEMSDPCPANWDSLVQLYRKIYDSVRPQVDSSTKVFATLTLQHLLAYDNNACPSPLVYEPCTGDPAPPTYAAPDPATCYPLDLTAISDLDQGNRLEILALSFYPDALLMDVADDNLIKLYPEDWDGVGECAVRAQALPFLDPTAALERFNWTKPMAIAELGARSDRTLQIRNGYLVKPPADLTSQGFWLDLFLSTALEKHFEFYVQSFSDDYDAIGPWTVQMGVLDAPTFSLLNNFAYMGLYDAQGSPKAGVTDTWMNALP